MDFMKQNLKPHLASAMQLVPQNMMRVIGCWATGAVQGDLPGPGILLLLLLLTSNS